MNTLKTLIFLNFITLVVIIVSVWLHDYSTQPHRTIVIPIESTIEVPKSIEPPKIISEVNEKNSKIHSFICEKANIQTWNQGIRLKSQGEMYYEPTKHFRFLIHSILSEEADMGSNDTSFWFWSKRSKEQGLYYAKYEDFNRTRLKTPLNPIWIRASLGFDPIDIKDAKFLDQGNDFIMAQETKNSIGCKIFSYIFIDKVNKRIRGFALSDFKNRPLASSEITYVNDLPFKIFYSWNEENRSVLIEFQNARTNKDLNKNLWIMPKKTPQIDMGKNVEGLTTLFVDPIMWR